MLKINRLLLDVYGGAEQCSLSEFDEHALGLAKNVLCFDSAVIADFAVVEAKKLAIQSIHLHNVPIEKLHDRQKSTGVEKLNGAKNLESRDSILVQAFKARGSTVTADAFKTFIASNDVDQLNYCKKYETAHSMVFVPHEKTPVINLIALWRAQPKNGYIARDVRLGNLILPHLLQAKEINKRQFATQQKSHFSSSVMLIASFDGRLYYVEPEAIKLLQSEWVEWTPPLLPAAFLNELKANSVRQYIGKQIVAYSIVLHDLLCIKLTSKPNHPHLTETEHRVAVMASQGFSYKEIAKRFDRAPATVRNQLHSVYQKLGVSNKTALTSVLSPFENL